MIRGVLLWVAILLWTCVSSARGRAPASGQVGGDWSMVSRDRAPPPRVGHTAIWTGSTMLIWGGGPVLEVDGPGVGNAFSPARDAWEPLPTDGAPRARSYHTAIWTEGQLLVWGGRIGATFYADLGRYDPAAATWRSTLDNGAPYARAYHTAVWTGSEMLVWGGLVSGPRHVQGARYRPATDAWIPLSPAGAPAPRVGHTAIWTGSRMLIWGGRTTQIGLLDERRPPESDGFAYDPASDTWQPLPTNGAPTARAGHSAIWTGSEMLIWGGWDERGPLATGGAYNPATNMWYPLPAAPLSPRQMHTAVWTGREMVVWAAVAPVTSQRASSHSVMVRATCRRHRPQGCPKAGVALQTVGPHRSKVSCSWRSLS